MCRRRKARRKHPLQALIFDSWFDSYRGAVVLVRVMEGRITQHMKIRLCASNEVYEVEDLGVLTPKPIVLDELSAGDVGFIIANIKRVADARVGDTVVEADRPAPPLPGFEAIKPMVFAGTVSGERERLRSAARRAGKIAAERRGVFLRAGKFGGAGLRFPLRFSRASAHGNRAGAARARIQHRPDHHGAERAVPHHEYGRRSSRGGQPHEISAARLDSENRRADADRDDHHVRRIAWAACWRCAKKSAACKRNSNISRRRASC